MPFRNRLLSALPPDEMSVVAPSLERVTLDVGRVLIDVERPIDGVWFPEDAVISQLSVMADRSAVETATIGFEGMAGLPLFHGVDSTPEHAFVQIGGVAHAIDAESFRAVLPQCPTLVAELHRFAQALFTFAAQSSGCHRKHTIEQRLARWLLIVHDRAGRDRLELTQRFLSQMLGVRRATVPVAAGVLQDAGLVRYTRGRIDVLDRAGLERIACECYAIVRAQYERLQEGVARPSPLTGVSLTGPDGMSTAGDGGPVRVEVDV